MSRRSRRGDPTEELVALPSESEGEEAEFEDVDDDDDSEAALAPGSDDEGAGEGDDDDDDEEDAAEHTSNLLFLAGACAGGDDDDSDEDDEEGAAAKGTKRHAEDEAAPAAKRSHTTESAFAAAAAAGTAATSVSHIGSLPLPVPTGATLSFGGGASPSPSPSPSAGGLSLGGGGGVGGISAAHSAYIDASRFRRPFCLHDASETGDVAFLKAAFGRVGGPNAESGPYLPHVRELRIDQRDMDSCSPLHVALLNGQLDCARVLVRNGASLTYRVEGSTSLHVAVAMGAFPHHTAFVVGAVKLLLAAGADPNAVDDLGRTPAHLAALVGHRDALRLLLADPRLWAGKAAAGDKDGNTALHLAAQYGHGDVVGVIVDEADAILAGAAADADETLARIDEAGAGAAGGGGDDRDDDDVDVGVAGAAGGRGDALRTAAQYRLASFTQAVLGGKNKQGWSALHTAMYYGVPCAHAVAQSVAAAAAGRPLDKSAVESALAAAPGPIASALIGKGLSLRAPDALGRTPLDWAIANLPKSAPAAAAIAGGSAAAAAAAAAGAAGAAGVSTSAGAAGAGQAQAATLVSWSADCFLHLTAPAISRRKDAPPPENVRRLRVLLDPSGGSLRAGEFMGRAISGVAASRAAAGAAAAAPAEYASSRGSVAFLASAQRAAIVDVLRCHEYSYVHKLKLAAESVASAQAAAFIAAQQANPLVLPVLPDLSFSLSPAAPLAHAHGPAGAAIGGTAVSQRQLDAAATAEAQAARARAKQVVSAEIENMDGDTALSSGSWPAALTAAGMCVDAVDRVVRGEARTAFCLVRPPGHHAGPTGVVHANEEKFGSSHGFCLLNNVAIAAAYARSTYRQVGAPSAAAAAAAAAGAGVGSSTAGVGAGGSRAIRRIAIVDFDVHHGNGTEAIVRNLTPNVATTKLEDEFMSSLVIRRQCYKPWLDESDANEVFFTSVHGLKDEGPWFYPGSGATTAGVVAAVETRANDADTVPASLLPYGSAAAATAKALSAPGSLTGFRPSAQILNVGMGCKRPVRLWRQAWRHAILPKILQHKPDIIFISAGFDAHNRDDINAGYLGVDERDYYWLTKQLVKVANTVCEGRIVSVLEGGYRIQGKSVSPFARSVAAHVRALSEGCSELWDPAFAAWERAQEDAEEEAARQALLEAERARNAALMGEGFALAPMVGLPALATAAPIATFAASAVSLPAATPAPDTEGLGLPQGFGADAAALASPVPPPLSAATMSDTPPDATETFGAPTPVSTAPSSAVQGRSRRAHAPVDYVALNAKLEAEEKAKRAGG